MNKGLVRLAVIYGFLGLLMIPLAKDVLDTGPVDAYQAAPENLPLTNVVLANALTVDFNAFTAEGQATACRVFQEHTDEMWDTIVGNGWDDDDLNRHTFEQQYQALCA